jgi:prepilin-type N-terminal cleavage/methylation domain-containing protein
MKNCRLPIFDCRLNDSRDKRRAYPECMPGRGQSAIKNRQSAIGNRQSGQGFTLTELLVVIALIGLILAVVLPSIGTLFASGADGPARSLMSAMLGAARQAAVENQTYTAVHVQMGVDEKCWIGVFSAQISPSDGKLRLAPLAGYKPQQAPGDMAYGAVDNKWVGNNDTFIAINDETGYPYQPDWTFTSFNVVFARDGTLASQIPTLDGTVNPLDIGAAPPNPPSADSVFTATFANTNTQKIWCSADPVVMGNSTGVNVGRPGVRVMTLFNYKTLRYMTDPAKRATYLQTSCQYLILDPCTGRLIQTK